MKHLKSFYEAFMMDKEPPYDFIKGDGCEIFLHTTSLENAEKISREGFLFANNNIMKTTDSVNCRPADFNFTVGYLLSQRKAYGECVIVIHVGFNLIKKYGSWEEHLSEEVTSNFDEEIFSDVECVNRLDVQFIKGYFIKSTGEYFINPKYNPKQDKPEFEKR